MGVAYTGKELNPEAFAQCHRPCREQAVLPGQTPCRAHKWERLVGELRLHEASTEKSGDREVAVAAILEQAVKAGYGG